MKTKQVLVIHGGDFFDTREEYVESLKKETLDKEDLLRGERQGWKNNLSRDLGKGYEVLRPRMPLEDNARYEEWKLWFEKTLPHLVDGCVLVGHSLGGIFLARYLSENTLPFKPSGLLLIAAPFLEEMKGVGKDSNAGFTVGKDLSNVPNVVPKVLILQSDDDELVPVDHANKYKKFMEKAKLVLVKGKNHFFKEETYPEILEAIEEIAEAI